MKAKRIKNDELLDLVNEKDEVIGTVWKSDAHKDPSKIHREVAVAVFNKQGEVLLQKRSLKKEHHPGRWAITAGHVGAGEEPEHAAKRELFEELGWKNEIKFLGKIFAQDNKESRIFWIYYVLVNGESSVNFDKEEIEDVGWINFRKIAEFSKENEYVLKGTTHRILTRVLTEVGI
ncbi:MAG: Nudix hydrolase 3 [Candidatus Woesebacteria bacterium GW2011_GWA1_39_12]|uniref:Nudix hydrolase 3 n=1 Tax=Candidatus Woesebacteria bacterium GW2011_GWA1_39_12 TaxID=1618549 RepID=A0A0G0MCS5_9BACT|nr:MAG: Nudix hydrolase 3 [Candidatus Woesebacteria bacterium GW2011_GWA1_39_12]